MLLIAIVRWVNVNQRTQLAAPAVKACKSNIHPHIDQSDSQCASFQHVLPSGKRLHNYGKSPSLMGKLTISMAIFNSYFDITRG